MIIRDVGFDQNKLDANHQSLITSIPLKVKIDDDPSWITFRGRISVSVAAQYLAKQTACNGVIPMIALQWCRQWQPPSKYANGNTLQYHVARQDCSRALPWLKLFLSNIYWRDRQCSKLTPSIFPATGTKTYLIAHMDSQVWAPCW